MTKRLSIILLFLCLVVSLIQNRLLSNRIGFLEAEKELKVFLSKDVAGKKGDYLIIETSEGVFWEDLTLDYQIIGDSHRFDNFEFLLFFANEHYYSVSLEKEGLVWNVSVIRKEEDLISHIQNK